MVASYCWSVDEQILLWNDYRQILWGKSIWYLKKCQYALSFWNLRFTKSLLFLFPFSNGLRMSLLLSCVKNLVISNGRTWFIYSKGRLLTQQIQEFLQVITRPFSWCIGWDLHGDEARVTLSSQHNERTSIGSVISSAWLVQSRLMKTCKKIWCKKYTNAR